MLFAPPNQALEGPARPTNADARANCAAARHAGGDCDHSRLPDRLALGRDRGNPGRSGQWRVQRPAFYVPLVHELDVLSKGRPVRVEVPPTQYHGESAYIAPAFSVARGWERQLDIAYNGLFYKTGALTPTSYRDWLLSNGVSYVALPDAPLDYAGTAEAALLRSGTIVGLQAVWNTAHWQLWRVSGSQGLAAAPASVVSLSPKAVVVRFSEAGTSVVKIRWASSWSLAAATGRGVCLIAAPGGWTELRTAHAGQFRLVVSVFGADHGNCKDAGDLLGRSRSRAT